MSYYGYYPRSLTVAERRAKAEKQMKKLRDKGVDIHPVFIEGRTIARTFWGKEWCKHLEKFSDYANRLPRGRSYVRHGSVCHLEIKAGRVEAMVAGSELYRLEIKVPFLDKAVWEEVKGRCRGQIGSMLELLQGRLSDRVMKVVSDHERGLFPKPEDIEFSCSCPDWAQMCKHVAAALYGVGSRLDEQPELLFILRGVDASELIEAEMALPTGDGDVADALADDALGDIFGVEIDTGDETDGFPVAEVAVSKEVAAPEARPSSRKGRKPSNAKNAKSGAKKASGKKKSLKRTGKKSKQKDSKKKTAKSFALDPKAPTGTAIAQLRKDGGFSVRDFAYILGVSVATVKRWESCPGALRIQTAPLAALERCAKRQGRV